MAYPALTTVENIESYFTSIKFTLTTAVTDSEIENWISQATSIIYGYLSDIYVIPITDLDDLKQLEPLADMYVIVNAKQALGTNQARRVANGKLIPVERTHNEFYKIMKLYQDLTITLPNTSYLDSKLQATSYNQINNIETQGCIEGNQW